MTGHTTRGPDATEANDNVSRSSPWTATIARRFLATLQLVVARGIATIASLLLIWTSLRRFSAADVVALQAALAAIALSGLIAESGIGIETTRLAVHYYNTSMSRRLLRYRAFLLVGALAAILVTYTVMHSYRTQAAILMLLPLAAATQIRTHNMSLLRSVHLGRFDLNVLPYATACDFFVGSIAIIQGANLTTVAGSIGFSSIITTLGMLIYFRSRRLYPPKTPPGLLEDVPALKNIVHRGLAPMLSGAGTLVLMMTLAESVMAPNAGAGVALAGAVGVRVLTAGYGIAVLVWVVPVHVSSARAGIPKGSALMAMATLFTLAVSATVAYALYAGEMTGEVLVVALGIGSVGAGLILQSDGIHKLHGDGIRAAVLPVAVSLAVIAAVPHFSVLLLPVAGAVTIGAGVVYQRSAADARRRYRLKGDKR